MGKSLFTIGYEGLTIGGFIRCLKKAGVETVVDVRELPLSHKPGFSKRALGEALAKAGLAYEHWPELGCPKPIRRRFRIDGDWKAYMRAFKASPRQGKGSDRQTGEPGQGHAGMPSLLRGRFQSLPPIHGCRRCAARGRAGDPSFERGPVRALNGGCRPLLPNFPAIR